MVTSFGWMGMRAPWRSWVPEAEGPEPEVVHNDGRLLVIHKPPGMPTTAPSATDPCLVHWVRTRFPHLQAHATSRLDSQVSGLVTFALDSEMNRHLLEARRAGTYERAYLGVTTHSLATAQGQWTWPISIDPRDAKRRVAGSGRGGRDALTLYEVVARTPNANLLRLKPQTGRTHQLRVHASEAGAPLFGDVQYGGQRRQVLADGSVVTARRVMLHCARVSFPSPFGDEPIQLEAPPRADMSRVWQALGGAPAALHA